MNIKKAFADKVLSSLGWRVDFKMPPGKHVIYCVYPHTSNWDFVLGVAVRMTVPIQMGFIGKESLFKTWNGWFFRWMGGRPVNRHKKADAVKAISATILQQESFYLALAPEGTRSFQPYLRSGFYFIAREANIPICLVYFDYKNKRVGLSEFFTPTGDIKADLAYIRKYFTKHAHGLRPEQQNTIEFKE